MKIPKYGSREGGGHWPRRKLDDEYNIWSETLNFLLSLTCV